MKEQSFLDIKDYSFSFGAKAVLQDLSFSFEPGEFASIVGPNGAGKTTLLKILIRILRGGAGTIKVRGKLLSDYEQPELAKVISYLPQRVPFLPGLTLEEFVFMGRFPYRRAFTFESKEGREAVRQALAITGLEELSSCQMDTLSGGECQKALLAASFAQGAELLLLDEPLAFLDYAHQGEVLSLLLRFNQEFGRSILMVTHDVNTVLAGNRVIGIKAGEKVFDGTHEAFMQPQSLENLYGKTFDFVRHPASGKTLAFCYGEALS